MSGKYSKTYCNRDCFLQYRKFHMNEFGLKGGVYSCAYCGMTGIKRKLSETRNEVYCSRSCSNKAHSKAIKDNPDLDKSDGISKECLFCHKTFYVKPHRYNISKFCSRLCTYEYRRNRRGFIGTKKDTSGDKNPNYRDSSNCQTARKQAIKKFGNKCIVCGFDIVTNVHHIVPRSIGGKNQINNLVILCPNHHAMAHLNFIPVEELIRLNRDLVAQK